MRSDRAIARVVAAASARYRAAGLFARQFARGKLKYDPVFEALLAQGLLSGRTRILDLGCGQGLLAAWLLAARACHGAGNAGAWPAAWPPPLQLASYRGIDINPHEVGRGHRAFGPGAATCSGARICIVHGDIRNVDYGSADAVVILDVLHYLDPAAQEAVLARTRAALTPRGLLLLRVGDAAAGARFTFGRAVDGIVGFARRGRWPVLGGRTADEWYALLTRLGFDATRQPMSRGTPFANVLLIAHAP